MTRGIASFFATAREGLARLGAESADEALSYYEEFAAEALEAGKTEAEVLERLGRVEDVISQILSEDSMSRAEASPGPGSLTRATRGGLGRHRRLRLIAGAAGRAGLLSAALPPYFLSMAFYLLALASLLGAIAGVAAGVLAYFDVSPAFVASKVGAVGIGIVGLSAFICLAASFRFIADALARFTLGLMRRSLGKGSPGKGSLGEGGLGMAGQAASAHKTPRTPRRGRMKALVAATGAAFILGLALIAFSGIGARYFSIWNSMKPAVLATREGEWKLSAIDSIAISTLNSDILVLTSSGHPGILRAAYEEPDWMSGSYTLANGRLEFREVSSGRLPFLKFAAAHPGTTAIRLELPEDWQSARSKPEGLRTAIFKPLGIEALSIGGRVDLGPLGGKK
ncbi:MAG TPA: hypothetical protein VMV44_00040 [Rectinemataceae bacterium]|nr:hypothetical protein [Rectinemataceae bacterium]